MASGAPSGSSANAAAASESPALELFVPGRVCLLGEHTDWAGGFRRFNPALCAGYTVVTGTNQGIHARVRKCKGFLRLSSTDNAGARQHAEISMDLDTLLRAAREGGHFSYIAGVAYKVSRRPIGGQVQADTDRQC
jgi:galactokinase